MEKIKCPECGEINRFENNICSKCGYPFDDIKNQEFERQIREAEEEATMLKEKLF